MIEAVMRVLKLLLVVLLLSFIGSAQRTEPASKTELAEITERGRMLFSYDVAAWHSTDAVLALAPPAGSFERYVAQRSTSGVWTVAYGKFNSARDKFLIVFEAVQGVTPSEFKVRKLDVPKVFAARAIEVARNDFGNVDRPYNAAVIPAKSDQFYVYVMPAQTKAGIFPLGGDARYLVSADGLKIIEKRQLHKSIIEFTAPEGIKVASGYHTAVLDDAPEDTDVFHVLARSPSIDEWVVTNKYLYMITKDGTAKYLMTREAFQKIGKQADANKPAN